MRNEGQLCSNAPLGREILVHVLLCSIDDGMDGLIRDHSRAIEHGELVHCERPPDRKVSTASYTVFKAFE